MTLAASKMDMVEACLQALQEQANSFQEKLRIHDELLRKHLKAHELEVTQHRCDLRLRRSKFLERSQRLRKLSCEQSEATAEAAVQTLRTPARLPPGLSEPTQPDRKDSDIVPHKLDDSDVEDVTDATLDGPDAQDHWLHETG
eukprot:TRINITY_DN15474_c0_g1_i2.p1 TRINITY_DN15474_c0_g1~~TRINITY_DN15474_c0_g1_i2.p1  ORF type:complete len:143 (-),score=31.60 TRINITY_DN15474_c0_g1_i2:99-527(-)